MPAGWSRSGICAQSTGELVGALLKQVWGIEENSFLRRLAVSRGAVDGLFLGATSNGKGKDYGWTDGSDWDYQNFYAGENG